MIYSFSRALSLFFVVGLQASGKDEQELVIGTEFGALVGTADKNGCDEWLGIPFAKPPIGELRFADTIEWSQPYEDGRWDATKQGALCAQRAGGSEDCLYLNLWRPTIPSTNATLPVMIFIHGGSFTSGSSKAAGLYNGCNLSKEQEVLVASMNYRLGPFGFAAFADEGTGTAANFGLQDQRVAIQWIKNQITYFGGDPDAITIFGESAGAMSVLSHVASPRSQGLFRAAISESGYPIALSWEQGMDVTFQFARKAGCTEKEVASMRTCLRAKSTKQLIQAAGDSINPLKFLVHTGWNPVIDGSELSEHPLRALSSTSGPSVPLFLGTNTNEGNLFVWRKYKFRMLDFQFRIWLKGFTTSHNVETKFNSTEMDQVKALYKGISDNRIKASTIGTDGSFLCGTQAVARAYQRANVFVYRFNHRPKCPTANFLAPGVYHTLELMFIFNNPQVWFCEFDAVDKAVGLRMRTMWANFAKTKDPSQDPASNIQAVRFPPYTDSDRQDLVIHSTGDEIEIDYRATYCKFWQNAIFNKLKSRPHGSIRGW